MDALQLRRRAIIGSKPMMDVVWNQLIGSLDSYDLRNASITSKSVSGSQCDVRGTQAVTANAYAFGIVKMNALTYTTGHIYCGFNTVSSNLTGRIITQFFEKGYVIPASSSFIRVGNILNPTGVDNRVLVANESGQSITSDIFLSIKNLMLYDLTAMFGAGNEPATVAQFEAWLAENGIDINEYQAYDAGTTKRMTKPSWVV